MQKHPTITMRFGAAHNEITVDGTKFDRGSLSRSEYGKFRRILTGALEKTGYFPKRGRK